MIQLSEDYIRGLEPETLRYDVTIDEDFVISVLPNGIKTWAFLYEYQGRQRRKTLGVYPDMSNQQALQALANARKMVVTLGADFNDRAVEDGNVAIAAPAHATQPLSPAARPAVLSTGKRFRVKPKPSRWRRKAVLLPALGALALAAAGAAFFVQWQSGNSPPTDAPRLPTASASSTVRLAQRAAPQPIAVTPRSVPTSTASDDTSPLPSAEEALAGQHSSSAVAELTGPATPPPAAVPTAPTPAPDNSQRPQEATRATIPEPPTSPPKRTPPQATGTAPTSVAPPTGATATGGQVTRAVITSGVTDLEPDDNLGADLLLGDDGFRTVFFFTELRNFSRGHVVHRWALDGRVIADVPLRVDGGWRWRTYSSKDLLPGMTGDWQVAVIDGDGRVLSERAFSFRR